MIVRCVERYRGDYKVQSFSCLDQFLALDFAQLSYRESLRDIEACLCSMQPRPFHMGFRSEVARNTCAGSMGARADRVVCQHFGDVRDVCDTYWRPDHTESPWPRTDTAPLELITLRHTFAMSYLRAGGNLFYLSRVLGHTSVRTTERYLQTVRAEDLQAVHDRFSLLTPERLRAARGESAMR